MKYLFSLIALTAVLASCTSAPAPEPAPQPNDQPKQPVAADPLSGQWVGEWGPSPARQTAVMLELKWDGTTLTGTVNPGRNAIELSKAAFDPASQSVTLELDAPNADREIVRYIVKGKVEGKTMSGTFDRGGEAGIFKLEKL